MNDNPPYIVSLNYESEIIAFNNRNPWICVILPIFNRAQDETLAQISVRTDERLNIVISQLTRMALRNFEAILHLSSSGHGFASAALLRVMFEKTVDALYLHKFPNEVDDFWEFGYLRLIEVGKEDLVNEIDADYKIKIARFYRNKERNRPRWSKKTLVKKAEAVNVDMQFIQGAYRYNNLYIHSSMEEVLGTFVIEDDGSLSPSTPEKHGEHKQADYAVLFGFFLACELLELVIRHFSLLNKGAFEDFHAQINNLIKTLAKSA